MLSSNQEIKSSPRRRDRSREKHEEARKERGSAEQELVVWATLTRVCGGSFTLARALLKKIKRRGPSSRPRRLLFTPWKTVVEEPRAADRALNEHDGKGWKMTKPPEDEEEETARRGVLGKTPTNV